jgi:hypothetical protein
MDAVIEVQSGRGMLAGSRPAHLMVQIEVDLADGNSVRTAVPGLPIAIQPAGAGNSAPP